MIRRSFLGLLVASPFFRPSKNEVVVGAVTKNSAEPTDTDLDRINRLWNEKISELNETLYSSDGNGWVRSTSITYFAE